MNVASYRPRNPGHDYYGRGIYLVTNSDYSRFHNLNKIAADICAFNGDAKIVMITGKITQKK